MKYMLVTILLLLSWTLQAEEGKEVEQLRQQLTKLMTGVKIDAVKESEIPGLYEVTIGPRLYYVSKDGRYLLQGHMIDLHSRTDITEARLKQARLKTLEGLSDDEMIIFSPAKPKHAITVFTDIDCGYCRRLHSQIDEYLKRGVRVRYMFFPRAGKDSDSYNKAVAVWCSKDRQESLTAAKQGEPVEMKTCDHPVDDHMRLAQDFGVTGTPMIITDKGDVLPGYVPPATLEKYLNEE